MFAIQADATNAIRALQDDKSSLFSAAERGYYDYVEAILDLGISVDSVDMNGNTALLSIAMSTRHFDQEAWAESNEVLEVASLLVQRGASIEAIDTSFQQTPLGGAVTLNPKP